METESPMSPLLSAGDDPDSIECSELTWNESSRTPFWEPLHLRYCLQRQEDSYDVYRIETRAAETLISVIADTELEERGRKMSFGKGTDILHFQKKLIHRIPDMFISVEGRKTTYWNYEVHQSAKGVCQIILIGHTPYGPPATEVKHEIFGELVSSGQVLVIFELDLIFSEVLDRTVHGHRSGKLHRHYQLYIVFELDESENTTEPHQAHLLYVRVCEGTRVADIFNTLMYKSVVAWKDIQVQLLDHKNWGDPELRTAPNGSSTSPEELEAIYEPFNLRKMEEENPSLTVEDAGWFRSAEGKAVVLVIDNSKPRKPSEPALEH